MKYLILALTLFAFIFSGFSQVETTVWNGKTYYIYPHQEEVQNAEIYMYAFADYREVLTRDDKNRKVVSVKTEPIDDYYKNMYRQQKMTRDKKQQEKFLREMLNKRPELFYQYGIGIEKNVTPSLENIPDGDYIQYYRDLPYLEGNTIRYRNDVVAGVFHVKNNQPEGDARWFTVNGMILKTGTYSNGSRDGKWLTYTYQPRFDKMAAGKKEHEIMAYLLSEELQYDTLMESYYFTSGLKNGAYSQVSNNRELVTGSYKNDNESGSWTYREFLMIADGPYLSRQTDTLIVIKHYTLPEKPVRGKSVIIRNEVVASEFQYADEMQFMALTDEDEPDSNRLVLYNDSPFSIYENYFDNFTDFFTVANVQKPEEGLELPEEAINSYEGEEYEGEQYFGEGEYMDYSDSYRDYSDQYYVDGKYYTVNELIDSAGYEFHYDFYEEFYRNGQLKIRFEVKDGVLTGEDTIYWDNGQAANTVWFDPAKREYVQHFFDFNGNLYKTMEFDEKGKQINVEEKKHDLLINGLPYTSYNGSALHYENEALKDGVTERTLIQQGLWTLDSTVCMEAYLDPATQTLEYTEYSIQKDRFYTQLAVFGEDYKNVNAVTNLHIGDLRLERTISGSLFDFSGFPYLFSHKNDSASPQTNALNWMGNYETQSDDILYRKDVPFTGKFELKTRTSGYKISAGESSLKIQLPESETDYKLQLKALKKYYKKGKRSTVLELYNEDMIYSTISNNVFLLFPFTGDFFNSFNEREYEEGEYNYEYGYGEEAPRKKKKTEAPYDQTVSGQFLNGKPEGEWIAKDQYGNVTARVIYVKGELQGNATHYATEMPLTAEEQLLRGQYVEKYHTYAFDPAPEKKVNYISRTEHYKNGRLEGPVITYNWKGDTTNYNDYHDGYQNGLSFQRSKLFYAIARFEDGQLDGISRTYMTIPGNDSILIFDLNFQNGALQGESRSYHTNGQLAKRGFFLTGQPIDDYEAYDTLGVRYQYVKFQFNQPVEEKIWEENQLSVRYLFDWKDSIPFQVSDIAGSSSFERLVVDLGLIRDPYSEPYYGRPSLVDKSGIDYTITKYYPNDTVAREGQISKGKKTGYWKYFSYEGKALYEVTYFDTLIALNDSVRFKSKGIITYLDENRKPTSKSWIIEKIEKYDCSHADHNEERMLYTFWERDSSVHRINGYVKNYYDNGAIQNEGWVENGIPTGIWKMYDSDGNLNQVGTYKLGKRDGRWLSGDLGNVKNMSEICLNPNLNNLEEIMAYQEKLLDVSVIYYGMGTVLKREYYGINMNNGDAPDNYYGEDGY